MNTTMMSFAVLATVGLASFAGTAHAQSQSQESSSLPGVAVVANAVRVPYRDLDTRTPAGMGDLKARVNQAAVQVCRFHSGMLQEPVPEFQCRYDARAGAWEQYARNEARRSYARHEGDQAQTEQVLELARVDSTTR